MIRLATFAGINLILCSCAGSAVLQNATPADPLSLDDLTFWGVVVAVAVLGFHGLGIVSAFHALMKCRTSQSSVAWGISLVSFPYLALPFYWVFGRTKYHGYVTSRHKGDLEINHIAQELAKYAPKFRERLEQQETPQIAVEELVRIPFTHNNDAKLLIDGEATFGAIFAAIDAAESYVLVQFFIIHADELGNDLKDRLIAKASSGVRVYLLYDHIGSHGLPRAYLEGLREGGVHVEAFRTTKGPRNRFQLNFRNHRKIVVVDGRTAYIGGHNVGDEYMGRDEDFGPWRDTHVQIEGPCVQVAQLTFVEDWYWATHEVPLLNWVPVAATSGDRQMLVFPTGPADELASYGLLFGIAIHRAKRRIWIATPYFVPDLQVIAALQVAALRGVDVRIMLPEKPDHQLVYLASFSYYDETLPYGVKIYRYMPGFLHQKVFLIDDEFACVGTANMDNRSFRLNFEVSVLFVDAPFAAEIAKMLEKDFSKCRECSLDEFQKRPLAFKVAVAFARLLSPIL